MAEEKEQSTTAQVVNTAGKAASAGKAIVDAAKAIAKGAAGDVAGAVADVAKNPELVKAIVTTVVVAFLLFAFILMAVGASIIQTIQMIADTLAENYMENMTEGAIESNGNMIELVSTVFGSAGYEALWDTIHDLFIKDDNHESGTSFGKEDYQTSVDAVINAEAFAGENGALRKRIDLIKGRVEERGNQIQLTMLNYAWDAMGLKLALNICEKADNFFLYNGVSNVSFNIDTRCFTMTDIQCIKILAAYCAQWECNIQSVDIWGLMNYLGWYSTDNGSAAMQDSTNSGTIYDTSLISRFTEEFYGAFSAGTVVNAGDLTSIELNAPEIPIWKGTFIPQYVLEEMKQLIDMENNGLIELPRNILGEIDWEECCPNYEYASGYGIIDYIFTGSAFASFSRTDYTGLDAELDEFLAQLSDKGLSQIVTWWNELWGNAPPTPTFANVTKSGINQKCTVTQQIYADGSPSTYLVSVDSSLYQETPFSMAIALSGTDNYVEMKRGVEDTSNPHSQKFFYELDLQPNSEYSIYQMTPDFSGGYKYTWVDTFTTVFDTEEGELYQAYQIEIAIDVTYRARSIDELAFDIIGLWPGGLHEVEYNANGSLRAAGHTDNSLLRLNWRDAITDASGATHSYEFERLRGFQYEYYVDYVKGIAATLGDIDLTGLFSPEYKYGDNLVTIATDELNYYVMNSETGGYRYWDFASAVTGESYQKESRSGADWSAVFVMCCAYQCGYLGDDNCFGGFGCNAATWPTTCTELYNGLREHSSAKINESSNYSPFAGDLVFFSSMGPGSRTPDQVGIVVSVKDGQLLTIEGGSNNAVERCTYASYKVGSVAYSTKQGPMYISGYISPNYEEQFASGTQYLKNHTLVAASKRDAKQIHINGTPTTTILVGAGHFRLSQLPTVLKALEEYYPHLLNDHYADLSAAVNTAITHMENGTLTVQDISNISNRWYDFNLENSDALGTALTEISARYYVGPIAERLLSDTKFDWNKTAVRREILWQFATSTDQTHAVRQLLTEMVAQKDNELSDEDLLTLLMSTDQATGTSYIRSLLDEYSGMLWPDDHGKLQSAWIDCAEMNLNAVRGRFISGLL